MRAGSAIPVARHFETPQIFSVRLALWVLAADSACSADFAELRADRKSLREL
jgi:hypothetical protein